MQQTSQKRQKLQNCHFVSYGTIFYNKNGKTIPKLSYTNMFDILNPKSVWISSLATLSWKPDLTVLAPLSLIYCTK